MRGIHNRAAFFFQNEPAHFIFVHSPTMHLRAGMLRKNNLSILRRYAYDMLHACSTQALRKLPALRCPRENQYPVQHDHLSI